MKLNAILILALLFFSCGGESSIGLCIAYDENGEQVNCLGERSEEACAKLDADRHLGFDWKFSGANICAPPTPVD